jgi:hypothetical protein
MTVPKPTASPLVTPEEVISIARPLGKRQLEKLLGLASPSMLLVVGDAVSKSLVKRGLLAAAVPDRPDAWHRITPAGLRALADAYESGLLDQFMTKFPPIRERSGS